MLLTGLHQALRHITLGAWFTNFLSHGLSSTWGCMRDLMLASLALITEWRVQAGLASQQRRFHWDKRKRAYVQLQSGEQVKAGKRMRVESGALVAGKAQPSGMYQRWSRATQLRVAAPGDLEDPAAKPHANLADRCACLGTDLGCLGCIWRRRALSSNRGRWVAQPCMRAALSALRGVITDVWP